MNKQDQDAEWARIDDEAYRDGNPLATCIFIGIIFSVAAILILYVLSLVREINDESLAPVPKVYEIHV